MDNKNFPLVSIRCITYNQENYIKSALDGFIKQKTTFNVEAVVHDDASTDNTPHIIREYEDKYPNIIKPIYESENQYSKKDGSLGSIMYNACKGKYIALCEGDDYWIDPLKLQKQIDFLENNPEYSMCCTNASVYSNGEEISWQRLNESCDITPERMISGGGSLLFTCTQVYRREVFDVYSSLDFCTKCAVGDYPLQILSSLLGKVYYMHEKTSVYRYNSIGSWTEGTRKINILKQLDGWKSQLIMLSGFDRFSSKKYHRIFIQTMIGLVDWLCRDNIMEYKQILKYFEDVIKIPFIYKISYFQLKKNHKFLYNILLRLRRYYMYIYLRLI